MIPLTIPGHAQSQALLEPTVLAAVAVCSVDQAVALTGTGVGRVVLLTAPEETLQWTQQEKI